MGLDYILPNGVTKKEIIDACPYGMHPLELYTRLKLNDRARELRNDIYYEGSKSDKILFFPQLRKSLTELKKHGKTVDFLNSQIAKDYELSLDDYMAFIESTVESNESFKRLGERLR